MVKSHIPALLCHTSGDVCLFLSNNKTIKINIYFSSFYHYTLVTRLFDSFVSLLPSTTIEF